MIEHVVMIERTIGEALPGGEEQANAARQKLIIAGYRWPSAVSMRVSSACVLTASPRKKKIIYVLWPTWGLPRSDQATDVPIHEDHLGIG